MQTLTQPPLKVGDELAEKLAQILQKLQGESVPNDAIDFIHSVLFRVPSKPIPTPEGYWLIKNPNR